MADTPFPLPRELRESTILVGDGTAGPFGPSAYKIFDTLDVAVFARAAGETVFSDVTATVAVTKTTDLPYDTFSITFPAAVPATTEWYHQARRTAERSLAVTKAGSTNAAALEKELSKQATTESELRRDVDRSIRFSDPTITPTIDARPNEFLGLNLAGDRIVGKGLPSEIGAGDMLASNNLAEVDAVFAAGNLKLVKFGTLAGLLADGKLANAAALDRIAVAEGQIVEAGGYRYQRAAAAATDHHLETSGGVKFYVLPNADGAVNIVQFADSSTFFTAGPAFTNAVNAAIKFQNLRGGGIVDVPNLGQAYAAGDGDGSSGTKGQHIYLRGNVTVRFAPGVKIDNRATGMVEDYFANQDQNSLFIWDAVPTHSPALTEDPAAPTELVNAWVIGWPYADCGGKSVKLFNIWGRIRNCGIEAEAYDTQTFVGAVVDDVTLPAADRVTAFDGLTLAVRYRGPVLANSYALINVFPARVDGTKPASKNLYLDLDLDGTGGTSVTMDVGHTTECIKINNTDGVYQRAGTLKLRGGRIACLNLSDGTCNVQLPSIDARDAAGGVIIGAASWNSIAVDGGHDIDIGIAFQSIMTIVSKAFVQQGHVPNINVRLLADNGGIELQEPTMERWAVTGQTGESWRLNELVTANGSATIYGWGDGYVVIGRASITGTIQQGDAFTTTQGTGPAAGNGAGTLGAMDDLDAMIGARYVGSIKGAGIDTPSPSIARSAITSLNLDLFIDGVGDNTKSQCNIGSANQPVNDSRVKLAFANPPVYSVENRGSGNVYELSSDNAGALNVEATLLRDYGDATVLLNPRIAAGQRVRKLFRKEAGSGLTVKGATGPSMLDIYTASGVTTPVRGDRAYRVEFDLSGDETTISLEKLANAFFVTSLEVLYPNGTTADDGVLISIGRPADLGAFTSFTSAVSASAGDSAVIVETGTPSAGKLSIDQMPAGQILTATCAGGKTGADKIVLIIHVADIHGI